MSGAEAITAIQLIDACIGIARTIIDIGRAVHDAQGLPPKLRELLEKLPAIQELLERAQESCKEGKLTEDSSKSAQPVLKQCAEALAELRDICRKACPKDGENRTKRVWRGAKTVFLSRDSQVQKLLVTIQDDLRLLEQKEIYVIGDKLNALQQVTQGLADNNHSQYTHTGAGHIIANQGGSPTNYVVDVTNNRQINNLGVYNEGPSTHNYTYLPQARPEAPPAPSHTIPFPRDPDFVDRGTLLDQIREKCVAPASRIALVGLGGVGKSQLAIEHCYRTTDASPETWVFWVHASNAARFEQSYRGIADCVKLSGRQDPKANIFKLVHDWLRSTSERWLLVLDNVDDARFLLESQPSGQGQPPLRTYLPRCKHGSMLITSRNKEAALTLVEHRDIVSVEPMDRVQAVALFGKKLGLPGDDSDVAELAAALEYMPLAIVQAAAYIAQRAPRCSVARYLDEFKKSERKRSSLLAHDSSQLQRDWEAKNSIVVTWQISFEHLQQTRPSAADLLSLMSFFDRQNINEGLIHTGARFRHYIAGLKIAKRRLNLAWNRRYFAGERMDDDEESDDEDDTFEDDVVTLRHFCFISIDSTGTAFEMHALVQLATRMWLAANGKLEQWRQKFISILCAIFPTTDNWEVCQALLAHVMSAVGHQPEEQSSLLEWATLLFRAGRIAELRAYVADAEILAVKAMEVRKKVLGEDHEDTLWSMEVAGTVHKLGGRLKEAEELLVQVMDTHKAKLGADHLATLNSMGHVAGVYLEQGRWDEAEKLLVQATETLKTKLGVDHSRTVISMSHLGLTYRSQGRWDAAEKLEVQVLEVLKIRHGVNHPDTLIVMGVLSLIYQEQGRHNESEKLGEQALELSKVKLGVDHIETLIIMGNMSLTYWSQGRWDDAEKLAEQVMEMRKAKLGANHPHTLASMSIYAFILEGRGSILRAMSLMEDCHKRRVEVLGAQHPSTLDSREMLARWHPKVIER